MMEKLSKSNEMLTSTKSLESAAFNERVLKALETISFLGKEFENTKDSIISIEKMQDILKKLQNQMKSFITVVEEGNDIKAKELIETVNKEIDGLNVVNAENSLDVMKSKASECILPSVMSIAAATKFYFSARTISKADDEKDERSRSGSTSRSQSTMDILGFTKACTKLSVYIKSTNVEKKAMLQHIHAILTFVKKFVSEDSFANILGAETVNQFVEIVKQIRAIQEEEEVNSKLIEDLIVALTPLASSVRTAAFTLHKSDSENSLNSLSRIKAVENGVDSISIKDTSAVEKKGNARPEMASSVKSFSNDSIDGTDSSPAQSRKKDSLSLAKSPLSPSGSFSSSVSKLPSDNASSIFRTLPRSDSTLTIDVNAVSYQVRSLIPTSVDVWPAFEEGGPKYGLVLDVTTYRNRVGEEIRSMRKSDREIRQLYEKLTLLAPPNSLPRFMEYVAGVPTRQEINEFMEVSKALFSAISQSIALLKSQPTVTFVHEGIVFIEATTPKIPTTPTPGSTLTLTRRKSEEPEAIFFTPSSISTVNRFNIFQVDPEDGKRKSVETATSSRSSKYFTFRSSKFMGSSKDYAGRGSFDSESIKNDGSSTYSADIDQVINSSWSISGVNRASKLFSFGGTGSIRMNMESRPKSDPVRRHGRESLSEIRERNDSFSQKKFDKFFETVQDKGYSKIAEDTITLTKDDKEQMIIKNINGNPKIQACELELLVETILTNQPFNDSTLVECFLITYRHFMKPHELLIKIIEKYKQDSSTEAGQTQITSFLSLWVSLSWDDFEKDPNLQTILVKFIDIVKNTKKVAAMAPQILAIMDNQKLAYNEAKKRAAEKEDSGKGLISDAGVAKFSSLDIDKLAEQITKIDFELFSVLKAVDFAEHIWSKDANVPGISNWVARFNQLSFWVGTEICTTPLLKTRVSVLENMIRLLKDLNNYNAVMAIVSGLSSASVRRLKKTWEVINTKLISTLHDIEKIVDPQFNYQVYRDYESRFRNVPFVPFLGLYLKDLTFANDGNPKILPNGLINFSKNWTIYEIIERIRQYQAIPYELEENKEYYDYCKKLIVLPENRLYKYSLRCEERTNKEANGTENVRMIEKWSK